MSEGQSHMPLLGVRFTQDELLEMINVAAHVWGVNPQAIDLLSPELRAKFSAEPSLITQGDHGARRGAFLLFGVPPVIK